MKIPTYITTEEHRIYMGISDAKVLVAGAFVKPIGLQYLPAHIKDTTDYRFFDPKTDVFVYCSFGIIKLPQAIVREI